MRSCGSLGGKVSGQLFHLDSIRVEFQEDKCWEHWNCHYSDRGDGQLREEWRNKKREDAHGPELHNRDTIQAEQTNANVQSF